RSTTTAGEDAQGLTFRTPHTGTSPAGIAARAPARRPSPEPSVEDTVRRQCNRTRQMPKGTLPLAGYMLARSVIGNPVEQEDVDRLLCANEAVRRTRNAFPFGRGNVDVDIGRTRLESTVRAAAAKTLLEEKLFTGTKVRVEDNENFYALCAMTGKVFGAGVCDNFAATAAFSYGRVAKDIGRPPGEEVRLVASRRQRHVWAEVSTPGTARAIVMDAWAEGPAVLAEDSRFAADLKGKYANSSLQIANAAEIGEWSDSASQSMQALEDVNARVEQAREKVIRTSGPTFARWSPKPVLRDTFTARAQGHLKPRDAWGMVPVEVQAAGVARLLGVERVRDRAAQAQEIVEAARTLGNTDSGPSRHG
ncbi:MAG TPA: hypothetical protein VFP68_11445, partial [Burkholderiaceae bacterium]|nr:hypothetical protein [Burkholderiaceae bacterium]